MTIAAVVTAAGSGTRLGASVPKALVPLHGRALVTWAVEGISHVADAVVVTAPAHQLAEFTQAVADAVVADGVRVTVVAGADTRQGSVAAGLMSLELADDDIVLIHDAARAFQEVSVMAATIEAVRAGADGAVPLLPVVDTLVTAPTAEGALGDPVDRADYRIVQTPQTFRARVALDAHRHGGPDRTDDATLARERGYRVIAVEGHESGTKITRPADLPLALHYAQARTAAAARTEEDG